MGPEVWGPIVGAAAGIIAAIIGIVGARRKAPTSRAKAFVLGYRVGEVDFYLKLIEEAGPIAPETIVPFQLAADDAQSRARALATQLGWAAPEGAKGILQAVDVQRDTLAANERAALQLGRRIARISNGSLLLFDQIKEGDETILVRSSTTKSGEAAMHDLEGLAGQAGLGRKFVEPVEIFWAGINKMSVGDRVPLDDHLRSIDDLREELSRRVEQAR